MGEFRVNGTLEECLSCGGTGESGDAGLFLDRENAKDYEKERLEDKAIREIPK